MKNPCKELCHKNNGCSAVDIYEIQQGAVQANQKKKSDFMHSSCSMDGHKIEEVALTCNKNLLA